MCPHICILYTVQYAVEDTGILQGHSEMNGNIILLGGKSNDTHDTTKSSFTI